MASSSHKTWIFVICDKQHPEFTEVRQVRPCKPQLNSTARCAVACCTEGCQGTMGEPWQYCAVAHKSDQAHAWQRAAERLRVLHRIPGTGG